MEVNKITMKTKLNILYRLIAKEKSELAHINSNEMATTRKKLGLEYPAELAQIKERFIAQLTKEYKERGGKRSV